MKRILPLLVLLAVLPACGEQTKWIYRNPSTGGGTLVDDTDENHALRNVRLTAADATTIRINRSNGASGDYDLSLPVMGEDGVTSYTIVGFVTSCFQDNGSIRSIVFPPGLEEIPERCFQSCPGLTNAPLPATLVSIGLNAFSGCSSLKGDIVLPDAVEEINGVWHGTKITSFTAGSGLLSIGNSSFQDMSSITNLDLSRAVSLRSIGTSCFESARNMACDLSGAGLPRTLSTLGKNAFYGCSKAIGDVVLPDAVTFVTNTFKSTQITSFTAGAGLLSIGSSAFQDMSSITNLDLSPAVSLRSIGEKCFQSARNLTCDLSGAGLPQTLETIGQSAFYGSSKVTGDVTLPETVTNLPKLVFCGTRITSVTAKGVRSIGEQCFKGVGSLARIELGWSLDELLGSEIIDGASSLRAVYWRSPPDPAKCTGEAPLGAWDWRANGCTNYIPWNPRTQTAAQPWLDFADEYNRAYGEIVLPARRHGVGTLRRTGRSATEYVAYWLPDLDPATILILK